MVVTQEDLTGFHGTNEKISVENLARSVRIYMQIIRLGSVAG
jgi:acetylornithine deacetylase/succinyl-diaminopimelate desuccinylase-like protein